MSNALSVFEKYLGHNNKSHTLVPANITDVNQIIGALQTIDKHLKNILTNLSSNEVDQDLIKCCTFMGENLFDKEILVSPIQKSFHIYNISDMLSNNTRSEVSDFIQEKRGEIASLLEHIFNFLDSDQENCSSSIQTQQSSSLQKFY